MLKIITHEDITTLLIILVVFLAAYWYLSVPKNLPPGPHGLPIVGYLPFLVKCPPKTITKLGEQYGSIFSFYLGSRLVVVLNDYKAVKEAFIKQADVFSGRPVAIAESVMGDKYVAECVAVGDGPLWKNHRKFLAKFMQDCGVGKLRIEPQILEEINRLLSHLKIANGKAKNIKDPIATSVANNISIMILGKQFEYNDASFLKLQHLLDKQLSSFTCTSLGACIFFQWLAYIPGLNNLINASLIKFIDRMHEYFIKIVDEQREKHIAGQRDNYINAYLTEQQQQLEKDKNVGDFSEMGLIRNAVILLNAGTETTSNTLLWGILYMMLNPEIQKKVQDELDNVIGSDRTPSWNDRLRTPYTEATICEIQRKANTVPINIPHRNKERCQVFGYTIPKSTFILANLGNILNDPKLWGDPESFRPERFLSESGKVQRPEYFIPFSIGKRDCVAQILARMELYLYFTSLLQIFTFALPDGYKPNLEGIYGITHPPHAFTTCAILRHK